MDLKAPLSRPALRGQRCSPALLGIVIGVIVASLIAFVVLKPNRNQAIQKAPAPTAVPLSSATQ